MIPPRATARRSPASSRSAPRTRRRSRSCVVDDTPAGDLPRSRRGARRPRAAASARRARARPARRPRAATSCCCSTTTSCPSRGSSPATRATTRGRPGSSWSARRRSPQPAGNGPDDVAARIHAQEYEERARRYQRRSRGPAAAPVGRQRLAAPRRRAARRDRLRPLHRALPRGPRLRPAPARRRAARRLRPGADRPPPLRAHAAPVAGRRAGARRRRGRAAPPARRRARQRPGPGLPPRPASARAGARRARRAPALRARHARALELLVRHGGRLGLFARADGGGPGPAARRAAPRCPGRRPRPTYLKVSIL